MYLVDLVTHPRKDVKYHVIIKVGNSDDLCFYICLPVDNSEVGNPEVIRNWSPPFPYQIDSPPESASCH